LGPRLHTALPRYRPAGPAGGRGRLSKRLYCLGAPIRGPLCNSPTSDALRCTDLLRGQATKHAQNATDVWPAAATASSSRWGFPEEQGSRCWTRNGASRANQTYCQKPLRTAHKAPPHTGAAGARARSGPGRPPARPARRFARALAGASQMRCQMRALSMAIGGR
jgi:hypothetical protein